MNNTNMNSCSSPHNRKRSAPDDDGSNSKKPTPFPRTPHNVLTSQLVVNKGWNKVGLSSPPQKEVTCVASNGVHESHRVDASIEEVERKMRTDENPQYIVEQGTHQEVTDDQKIAYYLYGTGFYEEKTKEVRKATIKEILEKKDAKERMLLFLKKDSDMTHCFENVRIWRNIQKLVLLYNKVDGASTIFQGVDGTRMPVVLRIQATGNCYQHATGGAVGYKIARDTGSKTVQTVDVAKFMRRHLTGQKLYNQVVGNQGGASKDLMKAMIHGSKLRVGLQVPPEDLAFNFDNSGPALIFRFRTDDLFKNKKGTYSVGISSFKEGKAYRIHQFDRKDDRDCHGYFVVGIPTDSELKEVEQMEEEDTKKSVDNKSDGGADAVPGVVSESFSEDSTMDIDNKVEDEETETFGLHSMILVGRRKEETTGKLWYLIQNTWKSMPIFEASESYLRHHLMNQPDHGFVDGELVFLTGTFAQGDQLPLVSKGLCLESSDCDGMEEAQVEEEAEDAWSSSYLEGESR